jgi:drug/metabolite transporter (DMT)-like permease
MNTFLVFLTFALWSASFPFGKIALLGASPAFITGTRMLLAGILLLFYIYFKKESLLLKKNQWLHLFLLSICAVYLTNILELWGLKYLSAGKTCLLFSLSPFLTALFSYFEWGETLTKKKILGLILGFLGILPIIINSQNEAAHAEFLYVSLAELAVLGAIVCSVYGWVILRKLGNDLEMSIPLANGYSMCIGGMLALIQSYFTESWSPSPVTEWAPFLEGFFVLLIVSNLICCNLYGYLLKKFTATFMSFAGMSTPIFAAILGWIFLKESVSWAFYLSLFILSFALYFVHSEELKNS